MNVDEHGWLVEEDGDPGVVRVPTVRTTTLAPEGLEGLVWHATGGVGAPSIAERLARRIASYKRGIDRPASWHVLIAADVGGTIFQSAPFTVGTWHVGRSGRIAGRQHANVNAVTIGVEVENAGQLVEVDGAFYAHPFWIRGDRGRPDARLRVPPERVAKVGKRAYARFTTDQYASARSLVIALTRVYRWGRERLSYCHADFAAPSKCDPGALWQTVILPKLVGEALRARIDDASERDVTVVTDLLPFDTTTAARAAS